MDTIFFEQNHSVGVLKISRPKALNALNQQVLSELNDLLTQLESNKTLRVLLVTGDGEKSFVAGADIKEMQNHSPDQAYKMSSFGQSVFSRLESLGFPTIACVNGFALGGGMELALSCDFIVCSDRARLGLPEVSLGLIPGYGGTQRLSRRIGPARAKRWIYSADMMSAQQAYDLGVVTDIFSSDHFMAECLKLAERISQKSPLAVSLAKKVIEKGIDFENHLGRGLGEEALAFKKTFEAQDHHEGIQAFIEKRNPNFKGE